MGEKKKIESHPSGIVKGLVVNPVQTIRLKIIAGVLLHCQHFANMKGSPRNIPGALGTLGTRQVLAGLELNPRRRLLRLDTASSIR